MIANHLIGPGRRAGAAVVAGALLVAWWGLFWHEADRSVLTRVPVMDEAFYLREGEAIAAGRILPGHPFIMSPLYPYLVAATGSGRTFDARGVRQGAPPHGLRVAQALAWLVILALLYGTGRRLLPGWAAWIAPGLFALYRPAAIFATTTLLEIFLTAAVVGCLWLIARPGRGDPGAGEPLGSAILAGALAGWATLLRPVLILLLVPGWLALRGRGGRGARGERWRAGRRFGAFALTAVVVVAPVVIYNSALAGRLAGISLNGGLNLYIGAGQGASGLFRSFAGFDPESDPAGVAFLAERLGRPVAGPVEADRIWATEALAAARHHPLRALGLWLRKVWLHFASMEFAQVTPLPAWPREMAALRPLVVPYGLIAAAGLAGLLLVGARRAWLPWSGALALIIAGQSLFFVVSRYRLVIVPLLALFAAAWAAELAVRRGRARLRAVGAAVAAALVVMPWGLGAVRAGWRAGGFSNEASRWERLGGAADLAQAENLYRAAVAADSTQAPSWRGLARVVAAEGDPDAAERLLADGILRAQPAHVLERDLIVLLMKQGRAEAAVPRLAHYLEERPNDADMLHADVMALAQTGRPQEALEAARRLVAVAPADARGFNDVGILLARGGHPDQAREVFRRGLRLNPNDASLRHNLELVPGQPDSARSDRVP